MKPLWTRQLNGTDRNKDLRFKARHRYNVLTCEVKDVIVAEISKVTPLSANRRRPPGPRLANGSGPVGVSARCEARKQTDKETERNARLPVNVFRCGFLEEQWSV
ncbi:hypothetical protein F2P81_008539 [Scophthalmus maximus]|uniref:Uncharacterized protein n=1 Tax=Scophthalmus maximus TaxID=52904 RepID=A0A6A4TAX2_SCOMX|nr:hypothetical protein F2P81_008539 [Scophthalmus maximus]